jgi:hypothetical protein
VTFYPCAAGWGRAAAATELAGLLAFRRSNRAICARLGSCAEDPEANQSYEPESGLGVAIPDWPASTAVGKAVGVVVEPREENHRMYGGWWN